MDEYQQLIEKYKARIAEEFGKNASAPTKITSKEYTEFKEEIFPAHFSAYEKLCNFSGNLLKLKVDEAKAAKVQKDLDLCHLNVTPSGVTSFAILAAILTIVLGGVLGLMLSFIITPAGQPPNFFFVFFFFFVGLILIPVLQKVPSYLANSWRMKASNEMVQSVFYMVTYMRHTSNIERAIEFSSDHLDPPLSLDFRKILWDVENQRYSTIRDSAEAFLEKWKDSNKEFVESFHLIESSLFESSEERRLSLLDKALDVTLDGTYENMLHYAHSLQSPITMLHMLGIVLPILGLVILPLVVSFMGSGSSPFVSMMYISVLYNLTLPVVVYFLGKNILSKRPAGYGASDPSEKPGGEDLRYATLPLGKKLQIRVNPLYFSVMIFLVAFFIGFSPLVIHTIDPDFEIPPGESESAFKFLDYICPPCSETSAAGTCGPNCETKTGQYGMGASLLSLLFIAGLGTSLGLYFALRSRNVIKVRERTRQLEDEFSSALFQLGNRLGDGLPAEIAFSKVARTMEGSTTGDFFNVAERNITQLGMGLEESLFDSKVGAVVSFPSKVIESSMKVLVESIQKGPKIAAQALLSMSRYIKEIHRVEERLKDLMGEVISSMNSQIKFLTPAIAGIVIGITSMISTVLTRLSAQLTELASRGEGASFGTEMLSIFGVGIPTFHFQIVVGLYIVEIAYILTLLANGIENGADKAGERYTLGKNLISSTLLYCFIAAVVMIFFNLFAAKILVKVV